MSSYPNDPQFETVGFKAVTQSLASRSQSGKTYTRRVPGHQWAFTAEYPKLTRDQIAPLYAFSIEQDGMYGTFTVAPPDLATPRGTASGSLVVDGGSQSGTTLTIRGADPSQPFLLKAMDIFTIAGDLKVYMVVRDVASDGAGNAALTIRPMLEKIPPDGAVITTSNVAFTMSFASGIQEYSVAAPLIYGYKVDLIENV